MQASLVLKHNFEIDFNLNVLLLNIYTLLHLLDVDIELY